MLRVCVLALATALLLGLAPSAALARSQPLGIDLVDFQTHTPASGAKVEIFDMNGNKLAEGTTNANGHVAITVEVADDTKKVLITADTRDAEGRTAFWVLDIEHAAPGGMGAMMGVDTKSATGAEMVQLAQVAIARCDKAAYDRWVDELNRRVTRLEQARDRQQQTADQVARDNNLRVTDLAGAQKDLQRAEKAQAKLDPSLRNPRTLDDLSDYIEMLQGVEQIKGDIEEARRARESMPPFPEDCKKDKKVGLVPGQTACPDGSGGLLAGALNDVFDTDVDPACADQSRRRDTDRPKKDKRDHDRRD